MSKLPDLATRCWLQGIHVHSFWIFIRESGRILLIVALDGGWEPDHVLYDSGRILWLNESCADAVFGQGLGELERVCITIRVQTGHSVADAAHGYLLWCHCDHLLWNDIGGHDVERAEQIPIIPHISLLDVVCEDFLFLWVLLEILFEGAIAHELFLEFKHLLLGHRFVSEIVDNIFDS